MNTKFIRFSIVAILIGLFINTRSFAQESEVKDFKILYKFYTTKQVDNSRLLEVSFIAQHKKDRKNKVPVFGAEINFYNVTDDQDLLLGTVKTDKTGFSRLTLPDTHAYIKDVDGYINLKAVFEATDAIKSYKKSVAVQEMYFDLKLEEIDSVKTVLLKAFTLDSLKTKIPIEELDVVFLVGGMLSKMPIEEGTVEDGAYEFEFPTDLPGDVDGNLSVFVLLDDHDDFGNVIIQKNINWGVFTKRDVKVENSLWSEAAPLWMYIVLAILLFGVWANYIYSIINLFSINKEGKELALKSEEEPLINSI